ncbi:MAG: hypothetical protein DWQ34_25780 [Planctomycetota bacterium]|nr:MAG: hypothetical protein DWQ34_25780 [Planctomycetota bacterium]REK29738.1 MAG: hypothetical protein DWQ41_03625 [Planctomycetota bacterium]REK30440.1 MAG: hypothetical protein DWQ45_21410 [Planctomycetota bacterium]
MPRKKNEFHTVGQIAERLRRPLHRVLYVVRERRIEPVCRAGQTRMFDENAVKRIEAELDRIDQRKNSVR